MTFTGTQADVNPALRDCSSLPRQLQRPAQFTIVSTDLGKFCGGRRADRHHTVDITVNPVNDPPVNTVPGPQNCREDSKCRVRFANGNRLLISRP